MISFGVVSIGTAFIHNFGQLVATRVFLGLAEGGTLVSLKSPSSFAIVDMHRNCKSGLVYIMTRVNSFFCARVRDSLSHSSTEDRN